MPGLDNFRNLRRLRALNRILQVVFSLTLVAGLNFLSAGYFSRIDLTRDQQFSLSPETVAYLERIESPVRVFVTYTQEANPAFFEFVETLLNAYETKSRRGGKAMIEVEYVDVYQQRRRTRELVERYDIQEENTIVVVHGERQVTIDRTELFEVRNGEISGFRGEEVFTNAILEVYNPDRPRIYFTIGHGEKQLGNSDPGTGLSELASFLEEKNYQALPLDLTQSPAVPEDAALVVVAGLQSPLLPQEEEKLRTFLSEQSGRLAILLEPYRSHGLEDLFFDWGTLAEDMFVVDRAPNSSTAGGDLVIRRFAEHPITQFHIDYQLFALMGSSRPVRPDPGAPFDERLTVIPLLASSELSWAERTPPTQSSPAFDPKLDIRGPVSVGLAAERTAGETLGIKLPGGRLVVFGNSDFISNERIEAFGNRTLFLNTIKWMADRESTLNIESREVRSYRLVLAEGDLRKLLLGYLAVPSGVAFFGILILLFRKR